VAAGDAGSAAAAVCVLGAVSALAATIPARRAGRVDPAETLRWG
jgi:ABC-type lipoprotein release transport system permease subunit